VKFVGDKEFEDLCFDFGIELEDVVGLGERERERESQHTQLS
jgi:hypothetical protein